jgi:glycosyltransferase involved in cell wall biosynthesis
MVNQTDRNFEWLIVDDDSSDNSGDLVKQWQKEANFPIRYIYQNNSGKDIAYNLAAREAKGEFFVGAVKFISD